MKAQIILQVVIEVGTFLLAIIKLKKSKRKCHAEEATAEEAVQKNSVI